MTKIKKIVAAAIAAVSMGAIGVTAFAAEPIYRLTLYGDSFAGYYDFSPGERKAVKSDDAVVRVKYSNASSTNTAYISVYTDDSLDYPGERISTIKTVDKRATYPLEYICTSDKIPDIVYLFAETSDNYVYLEGTWIP